MNAQKIKGGAVRKGLYPEQKMVVESLQAAGVLQDLDPKLLEDGVVIGCGDCDRFWEYTEYHRQLLKETHGEEAGRLHPVTGNGGPLQLVRTDCEPEKANAVREWFFEQTEGSFLLKNFHRVILFGHAPCGQARLWNLSIEDTLDRYFEAADLVKKRFPDCEVAVRMHVDYGNNDMNTYHVDHASWVLYGKR